MNKGQLISETIFLLPNSSKKLNKTFCPYSKYRAHFCKYLVRSLEELKPRKIAFEIIWSLICVQKMPEIMTSMKLSILIPSLSKPISFINFNMYETSCIKKMTTWEKGGRMSLPPIFHHFILRNATQLFTAQLGRPLPRL